MWAAFWYMEYALHFNWAYQRWSLFYAGECWVVVTMRENTHRVMLCVLLFGSAFESEKQLNELKYLMNLLAMRSHFVRRSNVKCFPIHRFKRNIYNSSQRL